MLIPLRTVAAALVVAALAAGAHRTAGAQPSGVRRPLALVEADLITTTDVEARAAGHLREAERIYTGERLRKARAEILRRELDRVIEERLYVHEGRRLVEQYDGLKAWVEATVEDMVRETVQERGPAARYDKELRGHLREAVLYRLVLERHVRRALSVTPDEMRAYYKTHLEQFRIPLRVSYRQIFVPFADFERARDARDRAAWIRGNLAPDGHDFEDWVRKHSKGPRAAEGGAWKPGEWSTTDAAVREAVQKTSPGEISQAIGGQKGYYLIRVERVLPATHKTFREAQQEIARRLMEEKERRNREALLTRLRARFRVETLGGL